MPFIDAKFPSYDEFAKASIIDIYGESIKTSSKYDATTFESVVLLNSGEDFDVIPLPAYAQSFPLIATTVLDVNKDGFQDMIVGGAIYNTEVETPRWDSGTGLVLLSNKENNFVSLFNSRSGIFIDGNVKSFSTISVLDDQYLLAGINEGLLSIHKLNHD